MNLITKEMLSDLLNVAKTAGTFVTEQAVSIVNQALNYALFECVISILGCLSIYLFYYFIAKFLSAAEEANRIENTPSSLKTVNALKTSKSILFVVFTALVLYNAQGSVRTIGKIMISPKVYLLEEGASILSKLQSKPKSDVSELEKLFVPRKR